MTCIVAIDKEAVVGAAFLKRGIQYNLAFGWTIQ